jgi:putative membrane protein
MRRQERDHDDRRRPRRVYDVGSEPDPRFTLANERTLLAWLRTALAFVMTAIAAIALSDIAGSHALTTVVASGASIVGASAAVAAAFRWGAIERALRLGRPLPAPRLASVLVATVVLFGVATLAALVARGV